MVVWYISLPPIVEEGFVFSLFVLVQYKNLFSVRVNHIYRVVQTVAVRRHVCVAFAHRVQPVPGGHYGIVLPRTVVVGVQSVHEVQLLSVVFVRLHGSVRYRAVAERRAVWIVVVGLAHGTDVWLNNAQTLIQEGKATISTAICTRDDIMIYLIDKGLDESTSFKIMEAVRKGKVKKKGFEDGWEEAMREHQVPDWYIGSLAKIGYLFPKAHAVAYVMMAFRIAWFKVHEPLAFYSAYFYRRSQKDGFDAEMMTGGADAVRRKINELKKKPDVTAKEEDLMTTLEAVYEFNMRGFEFAPIDLYKSDAVKFVITDDGRLLPPFAQYYSGNIAYICQHGA